MNVKVVLKFSIFISILVGVLIYPRTPCACISQYDAANNLFPERLIEIEKHSDYALRQLMIGNLHRISPKLFDDYVFEKSAGYCRLNDDNKCQLILSKSFIRTSVLKIEVTRGDHGHINDVIVQIVTI
jgi:hypothetical protein